MNSEIFLTVTFQKMRLKMWLQTWKIIKLLIIMRHWTNTSKVYSSFKFTLR